MAYNKLRKVCYSTQSEGKKTWTDGLQYCQKTYQGGHLLYIETTQEMNNMELIYGMILYS